MVAKEELMLGNYVTYQGVPCSVFVVGENGIGIRDKSGNNTVVSEKRIDPIPITSKILEKNGFINDNGSRSYKWEENRYDNGYISCIKYSESFQFQIASPFKWLMSVDGYFKYVHELQNALHLCKIDKEIKCK